MNDTGGPSSGCIQRGLLLKEQRRYDEAEGFFRDALAQNPNDAFALMQLASCQLHQPDRARDALQTIDRALAVEPNEAAYHGMRSVILCALDRAADALKSAADGIVLDPSSSFVFTTLAQALLQLEKWNEAEIAARQALALDADNSGAANQLAQALRLQNKMEENASQIAGMLARDPENATTHCSAGWAALQRGERRIAEKHFLEALRLEPGSENARHGLLNSFRARSPFYRAYLAYSFWMQQLGRKARWAVVIGLLVISNFSREIFTGPMAFIGYAATTIYLLFVLWVWVARGFGNFILLFDRFAKHALVQGEKIEAVFVGGGISAGLLLLAAAFALKQDGLFLPAAALISTAFPFSLTFTNPSKAGKMLFGAIGTVGLLAFTVLLLHYVLHGSMSPSDLEMLLLYVAVAGSVISTWLGNVPALRRRAS